MYPVSQQFILSVKQNTRKYYWSGTITTKNNRIYEFSNQDIVKGSGYITKQCCGSNEIELGTVYAAELGITLFSDIDRYTLDDALIHLYYHLQLDDGTIETIPMGVFEVSEANRAIRCLEIKAYDYMLRFEKELKLSASSGTAYAFLLMACTECDVELAQTKAEIDLLSNGTETLGIYADNDMESYRDLLYYVAQVLGCFCTINRDGKLRLVQYSNNSSLDIPSTERFNSSYSDFVTRYTAVSSTNLMTEESEYYAIEPDDGLTLNLGVNPLLQFGLKTTRERMIREILSAITIVEYVPFDSSTIGNPALDVGDVLTFSGGHADNTKISCITSITYNIGGKQTLKCVGKNPKLAAAKSKNDKNITGLLNTIEAGKIVVYNFVNVSPFAIGNSPTEVMDITFTSKEETTAQFHAEILLEVVADEVEKIVDAEIIGEEETTPLKYKYTDKGTAELTVIYKMNNEEVTTFYPTKTCIDGKHILTLFLPITQVVENSENVLSVYLKIDGGNLTIGESQIRATISGQGLVAGIGDWNGRISISEVIERIAITEMDFSYTPITDTGAVIFPRIELQPITQALTRVAITDVAFNYDLLNERVTAVEVVNTFTLDKDFPPQYDPILVEINDSGAFCMVCDYTYVSASEEINVGVLQHLVIDTTDFERVEDMEVTTC